MCVFTTAGAGARGAVHALVNANRIEAVLVCMARPQFVEKSPISHASAKYVLDSVHEYTLTLMS